MTSLTAFAARLGVPLGIHSPEQFAELLDARTHGVPISHHRAALILRRVRFFAVAFAILVPLWSVVDALLLPRAIWNQLALLRVAAAAAFVLIAWLARSERTEARATHGPAPSPDLTRARLLLGGLLAIAPLFYLACEHDLQGQALVGAARVLAELYALLPFVIVAGLALFPLTVVEFHAYALPILLIAVGGIAHASDAALPQAFAAVWLLTLLLGVALFSSLGQLRDMLSQVSRASFDALTGTLTRRAGIDVLDLQFRLAAMSGAELSLLFVDLDQFKSINDGWGHEAGDVVLKAAANRLVSSVRKGDSAIRWGGEEFVLVLPTADAHEAAGIVQRIMRGGLGARPDGDRVTASVGIADIHEEASRDWKSMVELADKRMYRAKTTGRGRCICVDGSTLLWTTP